MLHLLNDQQLFWFAMTACALGGGVALAMLVAFFRPLRRERARISDWANTHFLYQRENHGKKYPITVDGRTWVIVEMIEGIEQQEAAE